MGKFKKRLKHGPFPLNPLRELREYHRTCRNSGRKPKIRSQKINSNYFFARKKTI